jgi:hypothetical protein
MVVLRAKCRGVEFCCDSQIEDSIAAVIEHIVAVHERMAKIDALAHFVHHNLTALGKFV